MPGTESSGWYRSASDINRVGGGRKYSRKRCRAGLALLLPFQNERRRQAGRGGKSRGRTPGKPARATQDLPDIRLWMHIHAHLAKIQTSIALERKYGPRRLHFLLHHIGRTERLAQRAFPATLVHLPSEERALARVIVVGLQHQAIAMFQ